MQTKIPRSLADLKAAVPGAAGHLDALLACDWGRVVGEPAQAVDPCHEMAKKRMVLHDGAATVDIKLCEAHHVRVAELTDPHLGEVGAVEAAPGRECGAVKIDQTLGVLGCSRPPHDDGMHWDPVTDKVWEDQ